MEDVDKSQLYEFDENYFAQGNHIKAMEVIEDSIFSQGKDKVLEFLNFEQGTILKAQARRTENTDVKFAFLLGSVECFSENEGFSSFCAVSLFDLGQQLGSSFYYKKSVDKAKEYLSILASFGQLNVDEQKSQKDLEKLVKYAVSRIAVAKTRVGSSMNKCEPKVLESKINTDPRKNEVKGLRSYWVGWNDEFKRNFMKVSIAKLRSFVEGAYGTEGRDALEQVLTSARENRKWRFWLCRSCSKKFSSPEECKNHLEQEHAAEFKPSSSKGKVQKISKVWARKISVGGWEPVDAIAAVEMIKNHLEDVKAFAYDNGWSKDWPLAADEERSKLLKEIQLLLVSFWDHKILSCSIRDWIMHFTVKNLAQFEVSEHTLTTECHLVETPQSICFLESCELNQVLDFLKKIKCERDDGTYLVCRAVDSFCDGTRVKEKIDFDPQFSFLLLDKRLLKGTISRFDDEGTINVFDPNVHYAKAQAHGDNILSWLADYTSGDEIFRFPKPVRAHNLDIWVAILRAVQFTCRTLGAKYAKKLEMLCYDAALIDAKNLCTREDERRKNIPEDQWNIYASLLCDKCEEHIRRDAGNSLTEKLFLCAVRDVLEGASHPTYDFPDLVDCITLIRRHKNLGDYKVLKSLDLLKSFVTNKVPIVDSRILLVENSRINLLNDLVRLSVFDYRSYILQPLKSFLQEELDGIVDMDAKAKLPASQPKILSEKKQEKEKNSGSNSKKKKHKTNKRTSTSMSSPHDQNGKHKSPVNLDPGITSPSLKTAEEVFVGPEDILSSERGRPEISFNTKNQEDATKDMQCIPGEDSLSKHLESLHGEAATRYNSALVMMLKDGIVDMESKANVAAAEPDLLLEKEKTSQSKKKKNKRNKRTSTSMSHLDKTVEHEHSVNLELEDSLSEYLESAHVEAATRYNSALDMTLKALLNIKVLQEDLVHNRQPIHGNLEEQVPCALQDFFSAFVSEQISEEGIYSYLLSNLLASLEEVNFMSSDAAGVVIAILEFWHCLKSPERESLVTRLFTLEEYERMSCRKCRRKPNYPEQNSYGIVMAADSIRDLKCAFGNIKFEDILKVILMKDKMLCATKTGGCGKTNFVHHIISRCPPIFTIVLEWEKNATEKEISETTKALDWEIDISRLYEGLEPNTKYRLVSMVGCGEEEEYICMAYKNNQWVSLRHEALAEEDVVIGNWKSVVRFCGERKVRPEILFYEAFQWPNM